MVENYTNAFLVSLGVWVFIALFSIWVVFGLIGAFLVSAFANRLISVELRHKDDAVDPRHPPHPRRHR